MNLCRLRQFRYVHDIKKASGSVFPCIFSDDFRPTIRKAASALHWNTCIMFELHGKLQKEADISNFIILEVKTSEKGGYSVTFSIR